MGVCICQVRYPLKEHQKCSSETLTSGPQDTPFKSYGQKLNESITLNFFVTFFHPIEPAVRRTKRNLKKTAFLGHPRLHLILVGYYKPNQASLGKLGMIIRKILQEDKENLMFYILYFIFCISVIPEYICGTISFPSGDIFPVLSY